MRVWITLHKSNNNYNKNKNQIIKRPHILNGYFMFTNFHRTNFFNSGVLFFASFFMLAWNRVRFSVSKALNSYAVYPGI